MAHDFEPNSPLNKIRAIYRSMTAKEKEIGDYILQNPQTIIHLSITELAENLGVAEATIFRLCKRLGYRGYQDLKIALASEVVKPNQHIHEEIADNDEINIIAQKVFASNIEAINDTLSLLDHEILEKVVEKLVHARKVDFYGSGGSAIIALDAYHKFFRIGLNCNAYSDAHLQVMSATLLTKEDIAIAFSHSGSNKDVIDAIKLAKESGATTVGITNYLKSPLSKEVDYVLHTSARETLFRTEAMSSRLGQLSLIDALNIAVSMKMQNKTLKNLKKIREAIAIKRF